jgi:hypothetical protein
MHATLKELVSVALCLLEMAQAVLSPSLLVAMMMMMTVSWCPI